MAKQAAVIAAPTTGDEIYDFSYTARNAEGKTVRGTAKAHARGDVTNAIIERGLVPLKVTGGPGTGLKTEIKVRKTAKHRSLVITTRMLASMYDAGLSPLEAMDIAIRDCEDLVLHDALVEVRLQMQNGVPLSAAMATQPAFPPLVVNFVAAGEAGGSVKEALNRVADQYDAEDKLRAKVKKAMMYPVVVLIISSLIFIFMMLYLVPNFAETFKEIGGPDTQLPFLTRLVVDASHVLKFALPIGALLVVPAYIAYRANARKPEVRAVVDPAKLKMPIFGNLFHKIALARFTRNLSGLLNAGVDRLEALDIAAKTVGNLPMESAIQAARDAQRQGHPLVDPLKEEPLFPNMVIQMVEVGERSGTTGKMLEKAADIYDRDVDQITDNMAALIEPLFLVVMGFMVGTIVVAIYLPYISLGEMLAG